jgi:hypothetical protein
MHTYIGCIIDKACTYMYCSIYKLCICWYLFVQADYCYRLITSYWYRLVIGCWQKLVQVYNGISHSDNVAVVSSFIRHLYFRTVGQGKDS